MPTFSPAWRTIADRSPHLTPRPKQVAAARLDALENDNADAEAGGSDDSEYEIEEGEGTNDERVAIERASRDAIPKNANSNVCSSRRATPSFLKTRTSRRLRSSNRIKTLTTHLAFRFSFDTHARAQASGRF